MRKYYSPSLLFICLLLLSPFINLRSQCSNSWLLINGRSHSNIQPGVEIGDLDVVGDQLTVEAAYNAWDGTDYYHDIVSKHCSSSDVNYLLRPNSAAITTDQGFFEVSYNPGCLDDAKLFHIAMVYDGTALKLYRDGSLVAETAAYGNLVNNDWPARFGTEGCNAYSVIDYRGLIYQIRIWSTVRNQSEIQSYMWQDLPDPTNQWGLEAYYKFNSLSNLQGNPAWDGILLGEATIGNSNPNCTNIFINPCEMVTDYRDRATVDCNSYLSVNANFSGVNIGDLDMGGNQLTIEALFNRRTSYDPAGEGGDIISKHSSAGDCNYFLRPDAAAIRVGSQFYKIKALCPAVVGRTHHVAMVWNGSTFSFYRDGELQGSVSTISGNLGTNNWPARIGTEANQNTNLPIHFNGYINEVRIWSEARTLNQLKNNADYYLITPYPASLVAYYQFNDYNNKVGSGLWNGTPFGNVSSNQSAPQFECTSSYLRCIVLTKTTPTTSTEEILNKDYFTISPNPAKSKVLLNIINEKEDVISIKLFNITGQLLYLQKEKVSQGTNTIELKNKQQLTSGLYMIQVDYPSKSLKQKLMIN